MTIPQPLAQPPGSARAFSCHIVASLRGHRLNTTWVFDVAKPHEVELHIRNTGQFWTFARTLLADLTQPAGDLAAGYVRLSPVDDFDTAVQLRDDSNRTVTLVVPTEALRAFAGRTYSLCPVDREPRPVFETVADVLRAAQVGGDR